MYLRAGKTPPSSLVNGSTRTPTAKIAVPSVLLTPEWVTPTNMNATIVKDNFVPTTSCARAARRTARRPASADHQVALTRSRMRSGPPGIAPGGRASPSGGRMSTSRTDTPAHRQPPDADGPAADAARAQQALRARPGADAASISTSPPVRSPRCAATTAPASRSLIKTISGLWDPDERRDPVEGQPVAPARPARCRGARDHDDLPGPRAVRQPRHRPEHVPRPRAAAPPACSTRRRWRSRRGRRSRSSR